jgi:LysR family transcriptional regulator, nitrogen assimilation regulatory protein
LDLKQLRYFARVAELGSFTRAAADLRVAQSALSYQIGELEAELGLALLNRHSRGVNLTEAGTSILERAYRVMQEASDLRTDAISRSRYPSGQIALAAPPSIARVLAPDLIETFRREYPQVRLTMREETVDVIYDWLLKEQVDVVLLYDRADAAAVQIEVLLTDTLHLVGSAKLPRPADLSVEVLAATPLVVTTPAYGWRRRLENGLQQFDLKPTIRAEIDSLSVIKELVIRGFAYAVLPSTAVYTELLDHTLWAKPIRGLSLESRLMMVRLKSRAHTPASDALAELIRRKSRNLLMDVHDHDAADDHNA